MKNLYLFFLVFIVGINSFAQKQIKPQTCLTDRLMEEAIQKNPEIKKQLELFDKTISEKSLTARNTNSVTITIPVVIYVVHDGQPLGVGSNISDVQVNTQITALNTYFSSYGLKFCLATKAGNTTNIPGTGVQNTPGILHINNAALADHDSNTELSALVNTANSSITRDKYLRIWVVKSIDGPTSGIKGYSMFPNTSSVFDGVVMQYDVFGDEVGSSCPGCTLMPIYNQGKILVHEVGHYLGLYHTFHESCAGMNSSTCSLEGDRVCDTPPVAAPNYGCVSGINSCHEASPDLPDDIHNFMDYGDNVCIYQFTSGQKDRMYNALNLSRSELFSYDNLIYTGVCGYQNLISATVTPSTYTPCAGVPVTFQSLAQPNATYAWNFGDPASGVNNTSTLQNPSHTFTASSLPYNVTLVVTNGTESVMSTTQIFASTCNPINNGDSYWYLSLSNGLKFNSGTPVFDTTFPENKYTYTSCAVQNDSSGNLLFYTNGTNIWNNSHTQINSIPLISNSWNNQVAIVPKPGDSTKFYIFHTSYGMNDPNTGFRYTIVDISSGNPVVTAINQPITTPPGYASGTDGAVTGATGITVIKHCSGYWILTTLEYGSGGYSYRLVAHSLTSSGIAYNSNASWQIPSIAGIYWTFQLKASPNGDKIALFQPNSTVKNYVLDFDKSNGSISNPIEITNISTAGTSFSPNSKLLYVTDNVKKNIFQYNLNAININNSKIEIGRVSNDNHIGQLQIGPDGKIYVGIGFSKKLGVIHSPNTLATQYDSNACYFSLNGPVKGFGTVNIGQGLPNLIDAKFETAYNNSISKYVIGCNAYKFFPDFCGTTFSWDFGDPGSGANNLSTLTTPTHTFSSNGTYTVSLKNSANTVIATTTITVQGLVTPTILGSSVACATGSNSTNNSVVLQPGQTAQWSITSGTGTISGQSNQSDVSINWTALPGIVSLTVTDASGCTSTVTKQIASECNTQPSCPSDYTFSVPEPASLQTYQASNTITTTTNYVVPSGYDITLTAGKAITIKAMTHIQNGAVFLAKIQPCSQFTTAKKQQVANINKLRAYPNPASSQVSIETDKEMTEISLISIEGRLIVSKKVANTNFHQLDIASYQNGIYILTVKNSDGTSEVIKIIKQ